MADNTPSAPAAPAMSGDFHQIMSAVMKRGDIGLALAVVATLVVLILPMPSWLLDVSLAFPRAA